MRIAALYDIHANPFALDAVLAEVASARADLVVVGGDAVAGPFPAETFDRLEALGDRCLFVRGNGDREVVEAADAPSRWCRERLGARVDAVAAWPLTSSLELGAFGSALFCHATPTSDDEIVTTLTPDAEFAAAFTGVELAVVGHTHVQFDRRVAGTRVVNAGSVGWPYEDTPGARWVLLDEEIRFLQTLYDVEAAASAIRASGYPDAEAGASQLLQPPAAAEATAYFEGRRAA